ncbi:MAG: hypothetical protein K1X55_05780 [Chitinophagales bacterium]|nr:hypothetical protein [Chitinophagales bacterium]
MKKGIRNLTYLIVAMFLFNSCVNLPDISPGEGSSVTVINVNEEWYWDFIFGGNNLNYDLDSDGDDDFKIIGGNSFSTEATAWASGGVLAYGIPVLDVTSEEQGIRRLTFGELGGGQIVNSKWSNNVQFFNFSEEKTYFMSFKAKLGSENSVHYCWAKVKHQNGSNGTVLQIGVADQPNRPIKMGEQ